MTDREDVVADASAQQLRVIAGAMGGGLAMMAGLVVWTYVNAAPRVPTATEVKSINALTVVTMVVGLFLIIMSEAAWRLMLRKAAGPLSGRVHRAYIVRLACREGAGLLGMTVAYIAALSGVLRVYPAYWVNLAPVALFIGFLATHWPSAGALTSEAREIAGSGL